MFSVLINKTLIVSHEKHFILTSFILDFLHKQKLYNHTKHTNGAQVYIPFLSYVEWLPLKGKVDNKILKNELSFHHAEYCSFSSLFVFVFFLVRKGFLGQEEGVPSSELCL